MTPVTAPPAPAPCLPQRGERYRLVAPNTPTAPRLVRDFIGTLLYVTEHPALADDARLCVSEIVTNAHCHTRSPLIRVDVTVNRRQVTVYVTDDDSGSPPGPRNAVHPDKGEHGRGLVLVDAVGARWGSTISGGPHGPDAKSVWFTLVE
ncbi:ATP-binding protein [Streptomyces sp. NPDC018000]|uniref:ATP-binding protein n=1 Tax=Streptomyces sp. NPDC018000 TaxID=3365028 RepID=UPI0037B376F3